MSESIINLDAEAFGHFHRTGKIKVHGNHSQGERTVVVLSFVEGESVTGDSALHIYLLPKEARVLARALSKGARMSEKVIAKVG